ncbi:MAG: hypothetical protein AAB482_00885 [Patescibacteria group bacterium]
MAHRANFYNSINRSRSFTLLESIVAIYVFLTGVVGAMTLANQSLSAASVFKDELVAANIAQEGVELLRNMRDTDFLMMQSSGPCFPPSCDANQAFNPPAACQDLNIGCRFTNLLALTLRSATGLTPCLNTVASGRECNFLKKDSDGFYQYDTGIVTKFDTRLFITPSNIANRTTIPVYPVHDWVVRSVVSWNRRFGTMSYTVNSQLTPWLE